jgi:CHASE1-domain containing sensor protein
MHLLARHQKFWAIALCFLAGLILILTDVSIAFAEQTKEQKAGQKMLNLEAANALWRLKRSLEKDGYYSGRVRLNVWRAAAIDAGKFDPKKYEAFKLQLYEKSLNASLKCIEYYIEENSYHDANMCLQTWQMHESTYQELVKRLSSLKEKPPE